jgi:hypothetical protein
LAVPIAGELLQAVAWRYSQSSILAARRNCASFRCAIRSQLAYMQASEYRRSSFVGKAHDHQ